MESPVLCKLRVDLGLGLFLWAGFQCGQAWPGVSPEVVLQPSGAGTAQSPALGRRAAPSPTLPVLSSPSRVGLRGAWPDKSHD